MTADHLKGLNSGSRWHRWEPHIHAPGTVLNDQFQGHDAWGDYLTAIEHSQPAIKVLGITDYYSTTIYERTRHAKIEGRLPQCDFIFPNIEMRLAFSTGKGSFVNIHLLVNPEDPEHLDQLKRFLRQLTFRAHEDTYECSKTDLIRLGRRSDANATSAEAALEVGSVQFKVAFEKLQDAYRDSRWAKENIVIAVSGNSHDGTSGIRSAADTALREEVEKFAHVIFSSSSNQRNFWLGRGVLNAGGIREKYGNLKPCLHGCDAHNLQTVGLPKNDHYSWVKGAPTFDSLRQACVEPERAYVGDAPPIGASPSQLIKSIQIDGAIWAKTPYLELNPGLVAIIGARGSGKTALADIIALGCDALSERPSKKSFLARARDLLTGASVRLVWGFEGVITEQPLDAIHPDFWAEYPRARYLSQQFVEELCSSDGMTDELLAEIERIVFESHDVSERDGTVEFNELLEIKASRFRLARSREEESLSSLSDRLGTELEKSKLVAPLKAQISEKTQLLARYMGDRSKLVSKGSEERVVRLDVLTKAAEKVRAYLRFFSNQQQSLLIMQDEVSDYRANQAPEALRRLQERHRASALRDNDWDPFLLDYSGDVDELLTNKLKASQALAQSWRGQPPPPPGNVETSFVPPDADLEKSTLAVLEAEIARLEKLIGADRDTVAKFAAVSKRIVGEITILQSLKDKLEDCEAADQRITTIVADRQNGYVRVFEAVLAEVAILEELYAPLMVRLAEAGDTVRKLSFSVRRVADVKRWADAGEELLDLRRQGPFKGHGALQTIAERMLKLAWETGDAEAVSAAMSAFRTENQEALLEHSPVAKTDQAGHRAWAKKLAQWLYSTNHISIHYSIDYDGVDIRKLSPGTRGIVLLLLYLALDDADDRPLIIDQPEENLDPKSIYDELVPLFLQAKSKRQVIVVTHNANLVINTDADQIIIASVGPHAVGQLPPISYVSGGLEEQHIRQQVCDVLEGGELAFIERARRLRVRLER